MHEFPNESEAFVLVKAMPQYGQRHGETVCCAGVDVSGNWVRLFPIKFRNLAEAQKFGRWQKIKFRWRKPTDDQRLESLRVDHQSIEVVGALKESERVKFLSPLAVTSLKKVLDEGKSLALLRPTNPKLIIEKKTYQEIEDERAKYESYSAQDDLFRTQKIVPLDPCPYRFKYKFRTDDGEHEMTCQDWETDATFYNRRNDDGEEKALTFIKRRFGEEYPSWGMAFAMGTHSRWHDTWLINGVLRLDNPAQGGFKL